MRVEFDRSFYKSLDRVNRKDIDIRIEKLIVSLENVSNLSQITNVKKMTGYQRYYRIRLGDYRLGVELIKSDAIRFIVVAHRKDIYNVFP